MTALKGREGDEIGMGHREGRPGKAAIVYAEENGRVGARARMLPRAGRSESQIED